MPPANHGIVHAIVWAFFCLCLPAVLPFITPAIAAADRAGPPVVLTNVAQVKRLSIDEAGRSHLVRLNGVITYLNPTRRLAYLQDATGGTFFVADHDRNDSGLQRGQRIAIEGITQSGEFAPYVCGPGDGPVTVIQSGPGALPEPRRLLLHESANPVNHSEWVEIVGVLRSVSRETNSAGADIEFELSTARGRFQATLAVGRDSDFDPDSLIGAVLRMRGVYESVFNQFRRLVGVRLLIQEVSDIRVDDPGQPHFEKLPVRTINSILRFEPGTALRLRVQGVVTKQEPGRGFYVRDSGGWLWVETPQAIALPPGTRVEVVGFPAAGEGFPLLQDAIVSETGKAGMGVPLSLLPEQAMAGKFHGALVTLRGLVVDRLMQPGNQNILVRSGDLFFRVRLAGERSQPMVDLPDQDAVVEVTGVCVNEFRRHPVSEPEKSPRYESISFHLAARSPADVKVVQPPPFWSFERVAWLLVALGLALLLALAWIRALRQRVASQTVLIQEKLERETVMEERTRIARELHDTLEQNLAGIQLQLDAVSGHLKDKPDAAGNTLDMARALLKHSRDETRRSVWDLRSAALESGDLSRAFQELFRVLYPNGSPRIDLSVTGAPRRILPVAENNILRIAQEAVNNAIEHGQADDIAVTLDYGTDEIRLIVRDNGRGFDPASVPSSRDGHFGLTGMRERANKLKATLDIRAAPGEPTIIELVLPSPAAAQSDAKAHSLPA